MPHARCAMTRVQTAQLLILLRKGSSISTFRHFLASQQDHPATSRSYEGLLLRRFNKYAADLDLSLDGPRPVVPAGNKPGEKRFKLDFNTLVERAAREAQRTGASKTKGKGRRGRRSGRKTKRQRRGRYRRRSGKHGKRPHPRHRKKAVRGRQPKTKGKGRY